MRLASLVMGLVGVVGAACASSGSQSTVTQDQSLIVRGARESIGMNTLRETDVRVDTIAVAARLLFQVLPTVFAQLNLKSAVIDSSTLNLTSVSTSFRRTFDGERISHFLSCGSSALGNNADQYFVNIRVQSWAERAGDSTAFLRTVVRASAHPADNGSASVVDCASTGRLEARVRQLAAIDALVKR